MDIPSVAKARAEVTEGFIQIETLVGRIITDYYFGQNNPMSLLFMLEMLYDEHCTFAMKRSVLRKVLDPLFQEKETRKKTEIEFQKLYRLNSVRNNFAHCGPDVVLAKDGKGMRFTPDPRNTCKQLDLESDLKAFKRLEPEVFRWLIELLPKVTSVREQAVSRFKDRMQNNLPHEK